jgi:hypothetical protein
MTNNIRAIRNNSNQEERRSTNGKEGGITMKDEDHKPTTADAGIPVSSDEHSC